MLQYEVAMQFRLPVDMQVGLYYYSINAFECNTYILYRYRAIRF